MAGLVRPLVDSYRRGVQQINAELDKIGRTGGGGTGSRRVAGAKEEADKVTQIHRRALSEQAGDLMRNLAIRKRYEQEVRAEAEKTARDEARRERAKFAAREHVLRIRQRQDAQDRRIQEQLQREAARSEESFGRRASYRSMRYFERSLGTGSRVAQDIARGAGVDFNIGSLVSSQVELQRRAADLSNAAFMPGATGAAGQRQRPEDLMAQAREVGNFAAIDPIKAMAGLQAFVAKTGDLETGRSLLQDMAKLSRATGASLDHMVDAAGDVANALGDVDGKADKVATVMRVIAGQGKIGAVEIKSFATQMAKVGASATAFEGKPEEAIATLGAMVQMSRAKGGSASATQAATSVASFTNTLRTPARMKAFEAATGKKFYDEKTGMLRNPEELIVESLRATKGDPGLFKKIFANTGGARAVEGFAATYRQAGGGEAGIAAVRAEFDKFRKIAMGQGEIQESFNRSMGTAEANVQLFNNQLADVGAKIAERVLPQLEKFGPRIVDLVGEFGKLISWAAENPLRAVITALGASITAGAAEAAMRAGIESAIKGSFVGAVAGAAPGNGQFVASPGGTAGKAIAAAATTLAIVATAVTITEVGMMVIDKVIESKSKAEERTQEQLTTLQNAISIAVNANERGTISPEQLAFVKRESAATQQKVAAAESVMPENVTPEGKAMNDIFSGIANFLSGGNVGRSFAAQNQAESDAMHLEDMKAELKTLRQVMERMADGTIDVRVVSGGGTPMIGPPRVLPSLD